MHQVSPQGPIQRPQAHREIRPHTVTVGIVTVARQGVAKVMENTHVEACASRAVNVTVRSGRPREYLTEREIDRLIEAAKGNRWGHRDATAILLAYRHGLRA